MAQKIENKDIFSPDFLEPQKKSFKEIIELIKLMESEMKDVLKVQQQLVKTSDKKSVEGLKARQQAIKTVGVASKELMNLEKQRIGVEEKSKIASQKVAQQIQKTSQQQLKTKQQKLKLDKEILNAEKALNQAIQQEKKAIQQGLKVQQEELKIKRQKLSIEIQEKKELQRLDNIKQKEIATAKKLATAAAKENSEYFKQSKRLNDLKRKYQDLILVQGKETRESRKLLREVTRLDKKLKKVDASVGNFQRSVGNYGKAFGKVTGVLRNFGLAVGGLAIIRNITGIVRNFEQSQADLASVLGVNVDEMKALTEQARELGATTRFTAGEVGALQKELAKLGFDQTEIKNMTEATLQLAAATGTELPRAAEVTGATLRGFGLDASETQRVVDVMAKSFSSSSLDMEKFATAMSSVAPVAKTAGLSVEKTTALLGTLTDRGLDASTAGTGLRNIFLELSKEGMTFEEAMLQINSASDKNAASLALFGKRGATVGTILSETSVSVAQLEAKLNDAGGAAEEMADKQLNTLNGALDLLKSAWEGVILDLEEGTGAFSGLKDVIFFLAENLKTIFKVITIATTSFITYKTVMLAGAAATKLYRIATIGFSIAQALLTGNIKKATIAMRLFNVAVKLNPIGLLITVLAGAVTAYILFADRTSEAAKQQKLFNDKVEEGKEKSDELVKSLQDQVKEKSRLIGLDLKKGKIEEEEAAKLTLDLLEKEEEKIVDLIIAKREQGDLVQENLEKEVQLLTKNFKAKKLNDQFEQLQFIRTRKSLIDQAIVKKALLEADVIALKENRIENQKLIDEANAEQIGKEKDFQEELTEEQIKGQEKRTKELGLYLIRLQDLQDAAIVSGFKREQQQLKRKFKRDIDAIKGNSQVEIDLRKALEDSLQTQLEEVREKYEQKEESQRKADSDKKKKHREEQNNEALAIDQEYFDEILDKQKKQLEIRAKTEEVAASEFLDLELDRLIAELELLEIYGKDTTDQLQKIADKKHQIHLANLDELAKADADAQKKKDDADAKRKKQQQDQLTALRSFADEAIKISNAKTDKEIENVDKELAASKKRQDELQTLAAQGNLTAEQSISAEIKRELELERQKEALEKKKARRQIILEGLDLLSSKIDNGDKDAVTSTLNDMTRLLGALAALPGFIDGTETTVGAALGKPQLNTGTDDYIVRVDGSEKILNPGMSARTGNMTTEEITRAAEMYSSGMFDQNLLIHPQVAALNQPFQNSNEILKKFDSLESTIRNKPILSDLKFDDLQKALVVTVEQNGDLKRAHYNLK